MGARHGLTRIPCHTTGWQAATATRSQCHPAVEAQGNTLNSQSEYPKGVARFVP